MKRWTKESIQDFVARTPESSSIEYLRPFEKQNRALNQQLGQQLKWNIVSMANLDGGLIFVGIDTRKPGYLLAPIKASAGEECLAGLHTIMAAEARPYKPRFSIHRVQLGAGSEADLLVVIEVVKSSHKHYLVTREGIFYPLRSGTNLAKLEIIAAKNREIAIDADLNDFIAFLKTYILPMFPGSFLTKTVISSPSQDIAALDEEHHRILVKPTKDYSMRLMIARPHVFTSEDKDIVKSILQEAYNSENIVASEYREALRAAALEIALCKYISPAHYATVVQIINGLTAWSIRTYEGRSASFGIRVNLKDNSPRAEGMAIGHIIAEDYFAVLSDGSHTFLETNAQGQVLGHLSTHGQGFNSSVLGPFQFARMASEAGAQQAVIVLTHHSELLIFIDKELKFARRRGFWLHFNHAPIIKLIAAGSKYVSETLRKAIYETLLDISFAKTGGTICICRKSSVKRLIQERGISTEDLFDHEEQSAKSRFLQHIVQNRSFSEIPRGLRKELLSIDGATIVHKDGHFICIGAIVKVHSGSPSGGRLAATQALSKYGPAFKVSSDGMISGYLFKEYERGSHQAEPNFDSTPQTGPESRIETLFTIA